MTAWLRENEAEKAIILSDYLTGNYVAAHSGRRVFVGHWAETMDYERKMADVDWFFATQTSDDWRRQLLAGYQITHIWFGPRERALGDFDPSASDFLEPVHSYQDVTLYAVTP